MLEVIGAARGSKSVQNWPEVWTASEERLQIRKEFDQMVAELSQIPDAGDSAAGYEAFAMPLSTQLWECFKRVWMQYWRTPSYIYSKLILVGVSSLFIGFTFYKAHNDLQGLQNQLVSCLQLPTMLQCSPPILSSRSSCCLSFSAILRSRLCRSSSTSDRCTKRVNDPQKHTPG